MMVAGSSHEVEMRTCDERKSVAIFRRVEDVLSEARSEKETVAQALARVRTLMHTEFRDVTIIRSFAIDDAQGLGEWHMRVRYPGGREVAITHDA
jgi:hypothetical protein